jgi:hypothetical protein
MKLVGVLLAVGTTASCLGGGGASVGKSASTYSCKDTKPIPAGTTDTEHRQGTTVRVVCNSFPWYAARTDPTSRLVTVSTPETCFTGTAIAHESGSTVDIAVMVEDFVEPHSCRLLRGGLVQLPVTLRHSLDDRFQGVRRRVALTGVLKGAQDRRAYPTPNRSFAWTPTWTPLRPHSMPVPTTY